MRQTFIRCAALRTFAQPSYHANAIAISSGGNSNISNESDGVELGAQGVVQTWGFSPPFSAAAAKHKDS
jgi:hypothetical protein